MTAQPLVSVLISAFNAETTIGETLESAVGQTWPYKEIVVVNDGSRDRTEQIARGFAAKGVTVLSTENRGLSAGLNYAYQHSQGDYVQYLDADDLLTPRKIEHQLATLRQSDSARLLLSAPWAPFYHRIRRARFVQNSLWEDLSPVEWLLRKMSQGIHMQNATWLVSRELAEAAGPWDESLQYDQDGEYFARVLLASTGTRFVPEAGIYYRSSGSSRISYIGNSHRKKDSLFRSMKLHIQYLRSLEDSARVRAACVAYLQLWYGVFYPSRPDIVSEAEALAAELGGRLEEPRLRPKYAWMIPLVGRNAAQRAQSVLPHFRASVARRFDKLMYNLKSAPERSA